MNKPLSLKKTLLFSVATVGLFFMAAELVSRAFFIYPGASDFIERRILEQSIPKYKAKGEFRIFLYGESTMQGDALYPKSTIDKWMSIYLEDVLGKQAAGNIKIYNLARLGCNSTFIAKSFIDTVPYKPDLAIFYSAHNNFVQLDNRHTNFNLQPLVFGDEGFFQEWGYRTLKRSAFVSQLIRLHIALKIQNHNHKDKLKTDKQPFVEIQEKFYNPEYDAITHESYVFKTIFSDWVRHINQIMSVARRHRIPVIFSKARRIIKNTHPTSLSMILRWFVSVLLCGKKTGKRRRAPTWQKVTKKLPVFMKPV